ncbi:type II toxin-antitoxin system HicA family toxin [bacterium]|nr:type II toxin-antitoxin system HicA family toxin [bacterium]
MPKNLSSRDIAIILTELGIYFKRHGKEDVFTGENKGKMRVVIVPRNKSNIPSGTLSSIWRQAGISKAEADEVWDRIK